MIGKTFSREWGHLCNPPFTFVSPHDSPSRSEPETGQPRCFTKMVLLISVAGLTSFMGGMSGWPMLVHTKEGHPEDPLSLLMFPASICLPMWLSPKFYHYFDLDNKVGTFYPECNFHNLFIIWDEDRPCGTHPFLPSFSSFLLLLKVLIRYLLFARQLPGT